MDAPHISRFVLWFFRRIARGYFRRSFSAVRLSSSSNLGNFKDQRLMIYGNHSSWWDPLVLVLLGAKLMAGRQHYAPMDAAALARYGILKHIGVFGVEMNSARGAARFLRTSKSIVEQGGVLWVTPQGRFVDVRQRPLGFKPGLAALAAKMKDGCTLVPLAIEYVFWDERLPETLLRLGEPVHVDGQSTEEVQQQLEAAMLKTMEELKAEAMARDPAAFSVILDGTVGTGGFYELGQRSLARLLRKKYEPAHANVHNEERG